MTTDKRAILNGMLHISTTGDELIRAGAPAGWRVGDRTGVAAYDNALIARAAKVALRYFR